MVWHYNLSMRTLVLILFLVFQSALACSVGQTAAVVENVEGWKNKTTASIKFLEDQGFEFNWEYLESYYIVFRIPEIKGEIGIDISELISVEESIVLELIKESKWDATYSSWYGATFQVGKYKIKIPSVFTPHYILNKLGIDSLSKKMNLENHLSENILCWFNHITWNFEDEKEFLYFNSTKSPIIAVSLTNEVTIIEFFDPIEILKLSFDSQFLYISNKLEDFEIYKNWQNTRISITFLFRITKNIGINQQIVEFISPCATKILKPSPN